MRTLSILAPIVAISLLSPSGSVRAQPDSFPTKPIRLVVPFSDRGAGGQFFKTFAEKLEVRLGKRVGAEFESDRNGLAAAELVAKSPPDGHTLLVTTTYNHSVVPAAARAVAYPSNSFCAIAL